MVKKKTCYEGIESPTVVSEPKVQNLGKTNQETVTMRFQKKAVNTETTTKIGKVQTRKKRARCFICRKGGHTFRNCPTKKETEKDKDAEKLAKNPVSLKYPEQIHLSTDYMVEGTDEGNSDHICQLEAQGVELNYNNNRCRLSYMFKHPEACKFDEDKMKEKQNQYLEKYFDSIDPKGDYVLEKTTWDKAVKKDYTDTDFIRMEDKIYPVKVDINYIQSN
ncbi:ARID DNA-binding domain-containing protein [Tanacetum coccineum]